MDRAVKGARQDRLGLGSLLAVEQPDLQGPRADPGLELGAGPLGHDPAVVDHRDLLGKLVGLGQVLGGDQHRGTGRGDLADQFPYLTLAARVHARGRLIEKQQIGGHYQAGPDVQPAAHPARVATRWTAGRAGQVEGGEQFIGSPPAGGARQATQAAEHDQVLVPSQVVIEGGELAGHGRPGPDRIPPARHVEPKDAGGAAVRPGQGGQDADGGGLAHPVGAEEPEHLAMLDREVDPIQRAGAALTPPRPRKRCAGISTSAGSSSAETPSCSGRLSPKAHIPDTPPLTSPASPGSNGSSEEASTPATLTARSQRPGSPSPSSGSYAAPPNNSPPAALPPATRRLWSWRAHCESAAPAAKAEAETSYRK